ncbi:lactosylceramide 4-alpha-galactosyltransferase-like [Tribolium madens]|uniref:lactosylceramide 4-alpha-galactosyltransferase-like n=1 Tax=Tribolium madens TaxID=41895 RepID=UPI001CF765BE|nr:lactosylceramide 4-alpha-galactosyltransferase-like [Tribolium madens]
MRISAKSTPTPLSVIVSTISTPRMLNHQTPRKTLLFALLIIAIIFLTQPQNSSLFNQIYYFFNPKESIQCYHNKSHTLPDISDTRPAKGRSIFFHETSCNSFHNGKITITARQACAVESAARLNPNFEVHLLFASPGIFRFEGTQSDRFLQNLLTYPNVRIHHVDYERYTKDTPVEDLYKRGEIELSGYAQSHASDVLRYITLWKFGGIYLDLDVIVTKPLEGLPPNYAGSESDRNVAAGVLSFTPEGLGHELAQRCLQDLSENFKGYDWGYNGPGVITRLLKQLCGVETANEMVQKDCQGFRVFPVEAFYPIPWWDWKLYFDENFTEKVLNISKNSHVIHVWNKHSGGTRVAARGNSAYAVLAQKFCPGIVNDCGYFF